MKLAFFSSEYIVASTLLWHSVSAQVVVPSGIGKTRTGKHVAQGNDVVTARKLSKSTKVQNINNDAAFARKLEGMYFYHGSCESVFQVNIVCDVFGDADPDLCLYQEFKAGEMIPDDREPPEDAEPIEGGGFMALEPYTSQTHVDPDDVCIFSGTFRSSSLRGVDGNVHQIPLATSEGCENVKNNYQYVLKMGMGSIDEESFLRMEFSDDGGDTFYTDDVDCPTKYKAVEYLTSSEMKGHTRSLLPLAELDNSPLYNRLPHDRLLHGRVLCPP